MVLLTVFEVPSLNDITSCLLALADVASELSTEILPCSLEVPVNLLVVFL